MSLKWVALPTLLLLFFGVQEGVALQRVAVAQFGATDRFAAHFGGWNIGGGLSAQLVTELIATDRVIVVERAILSKVLIEQELGESRLTTAMTKPPSGHLLGVDHLIVGEVTEFDERQVGSGAAARFLGMKVSGEVRAAHVGMDLRVVDTRTGEIIASHRAQGKAWEKAIGARADYKIIDFGGDAFHRTPLGKATRLAIRDALEFIISVIEEQSRDFSWLGLVIDVEGEHFYFNTGKRGGVHRGDELRVRRVRKVLTDPETNQVLGLLHDEIGSAKAIAVDEKYTKARLLKGTNVQPGDVVEFAHLKRRHHTLSTKYLTGYELLE